MRFVKAQNFVFELGHFGFHACQFLLVFFQLFAGMLNGIIGLDGCLALDQICLLAGFTDHIFSHALGIEQCALQCVFFLLIGFQLGAHFLDLLCQNHHFFLAGLVGCLGLGLGGQSLL